MSVADKGAKKKKADPGKKELKRRHDVAEARKAEIEVRRAEIGLELDELRRQEFVESYAWKLNGDRSHGVFNLDRSVGHNVVDMAAELRQYGRLAPNGPVTLNIFSPGGSVFDGLVLYDTLRELASHGHAITTVARGYAASMGSLLFLAGDNRLIGAEAQVMFHSLSAGTGGMLHDMEDDLEFFRKLNKRLDRIILSRTKVPAKTLEAKTRKKDWWCDAKTALRFKIATQII